MRTGSAKAAEIPFVLSLQNTPTSMPEMPDLLTQVRRLIPPEVSIWLVGGAVRDRLLGLPTRDLDFAIQGDALALARRVADSLDAAFYALDSERGAGRVILSGEETVSLDFAALRGPDLSTDLRGRDFTINALAISLHEPDDLIDPLGGEADLRARLLRPCSATTFQDDPVRTLRAIRLALGFGLRLHPETGQMLRDAGPQLIRVSPERVRDEFMHMLGGSKPASAIRALDVLGLLRFVMPELEGLKGVAQPPPHTRDVWEHSLAVLERLPALYSVLGRSHDPEASADLTLGLAAMRLGRYRHSLGEHLDARLSSDRPLRWLLNLAALLHDAAKPQTRTVDTEGRIRFLDHEHKGAELAQQCAVRFRLSTREAERLHTIVRHHMRPLLLAQHGRPTRRAIYRFFRDTGEAGVDICLLALADTLGTYGVTLPQDIWSQMLEVVAALLDACFQQADRVVSPPPLLTGNDLMAELHLRSGPLIGELLEAVREAQAVGEVGDRAAALELARRKLTSERGCAGPL